MREDYIYMAQVIKKMDTETLADMLTQMMTFSCTPVIMKNCNSCASCWRMYVDHFKNMNRRKNDGN